MSEKIPTTGPAYSFNTDKLGRPLYYSYDREDPKKVKTRLSEQTVIESVNIPVKTERGWYDQGFEDAQDKENLETEGFPKSASWSSLYNGDFQAKVLGKYEDGSYLIELTEEIGGSLKHRVPAQELVIVEYKDEPEAPVTSGESSDSPEVQALQEKVAQLGQQLEQQKAEFTQVIDDLKAVIEDLRQQLTEAKGETIDGDEFEWEPEVGDGVFAKGIDNTLDNKWTIVNIEGEGDDRRITIRRNQEEGSDLFEVTDSYDQFLKWQIEANSIEDRDEDEEKELKPGQKVKAFSRFRLAFEDDWTIEDIYEKDGVKMVALTKPGSKNKLRGEPEQLVLEAPYDRVLAWQEEKAGTVEVEEHDEDPLPPGLWARLRERFNRAKNRIAGEGYTAHNTVYVGGPNSTPEQQKRKRRLALLAAALGGAAVAALICDMTHEGGLIDGTWLDDGGDKGPGSGSEQGLNDPEGPKYGDITVNGGAGDDTFNIYPEGTESSTDAGNGNESGGEGNESEGGGNPPETATTGEAFTVEYGNGVTHEIQQYAQANGINISNEDAYRIYEQLEASQHDKIIDLHGTSADSYWYADAQSGPEVRIASPGTATWYPEAESQLKSALGLG